jgi:hypothetical protein
MLEKLVSIFFANFDKFQFNYFGLNDVIISKYTIYWFYHLGSLAETCA